MHAERLSENPIITPASHPSIGANINGPALLKVPAWLPNPLGRYYLYFADHRGKFIRLAYADDVEGPYRIHAPGTLRLEQTACTSHIASPDVHADDARREIRMYFHGTVPEGSPQQTFVAFSRDGLAFEARSERFGYPYMRVFEWDGWHYGLAMGKPGFRLYRSRDGLTNFEPGPVWPEVACRHCAVLREGETLFVFYSLVGDAPEHLVWSAVALTADWNAWKLTAPRTLLKPEREWEGAELPLEPSQYGWAPKPVRQLRDPGVYREGERRWIFYSIAGEQGLAVARLFIQ